MSSEILFMFSHGGTGGFAPAEGSMASARPFGGKHMRALLFFDVFERAA